ncbi:acyltransferase family protein [Dysgonomonas sp. 511]|uniref:acyltransferase family protein n=1 Tax=Dysgonomonas sp. 511 TaxID=2302930 RepID=UPI0013D4ED4D|nr:acyltransferase family protein [Dysgonomonas sp. 511]
MAEQRINWVDWAKVITIILVVFGHCSFWGEAVFFQNLVYSFHVPLFFLLSGYLHKDSSDFKSYISKNVKSLVVPYLLLNILVLCCVILPGMILHNNFMHFEYYITCILIGYGHAPAGPCWFLVCLFLVKIYAYAILKSKLPLQIAVMVVAPLIAIFVLVVVSNESVNFLLSNPLYSFCAIPFFIVGYHLKKVDLPTILTRRLAVFIALVALAFLVALNEVQGFAGLGAFGRYPLLYYPAAFIGCILVICVCLLLNNKQNKMIITLSSGTILILALHPVLYKIFAKFGQMPHSALPNIVVSILITILLYYPIVIVQKYIPVLIGRRKIKINQP